MNTQFIRKMLLMTAIVPLDASLWNQINYSSIPGHELTYKSEQIHLKVKNSAGILFHKFSNNLKVQAFKVSLELIGSLPVEVDKKTKWPEDSSFRLGLVVPGTKKLGGFKSLFAPNWLKKLFSLAPAGQGLDHIAFYMLGPDQSFLDKTRVYPGSDLLTETIVKVAKSGPIVFAHKLEKPLETAALWISVDGDQTKSNFSVLIKEIRIDQVKAKN